MKKTAENAAESITMTSLKKVDGSYTDAKSGAIVTIASAEELKMLSEYTRAEKRTSGVTFRQTADIDGTGMTMHGIGEVTYKWVTDEDGDSWYSAGDEQFRGTYDGSSKKISNLNVAVTPWDGNEDSEYYFEYYLGLFSRAEDATIQNIDLRSIRFVDEKSGEEFEAGAEKNMCVAGIVGYAEGESLISGCSNYADITAKANRAFAAGICGTTGELELKDCHNYGKITAVGDREGWAVGISRYVDMSVSGCSNAGAINASSVEKSGAFAFGLFYEVYGNISDCTNTGPVTSGGATNADGEAAGISRSCDEQVRRCVNSGDISAERAGGIICSMSYASIFDCSNSGKISGTQYAGGILALGSHVTLSGLSNTGEIIAEKRAGGIASLVIDSSIANVENFAKVSSQNIAGGAVGHAIELELVNVWNHGEISAGIYTGGIVGSADTKDVPDVFYVDMEDVEPCVFMNCIHLGTLTGGEHKAAIIAYSDKKDEFKCCYVPEESTDPVNGSDSSITAKKGFSRELETGGFY